MQRIYYVRKKSMNASITHSKSCLLLRNMSYVGKSVGSKIVRVTSASVRVVSIYVPVLIDQMKSIYSDIMWYNF